MSIVLAALDTSAAARAVLEAALGFAELTGATVEALHVRDGAVDTPATLARRSGIRFRVVDGPADEALLAAMADPEVIAAILGARGTPGGRRPTGHTALRVMARATKPIVVVPPEAVGVSPRPFRRLLLPLEGTEESSRPLTTILGPLIRKDVELLVVHVFTDDTVPRALDRPERDLQLLGGEFLAHYCPEGTKIDLRTGSVGNQVGAACREEHADLVVLSWSQDPSAGHAEVIRHVLGNSTVPVLLLPVRQESSDRPH
jgi:nucleotide-binding universal stress UspA family protein